jgi:CubicO group peptidase (beta-lactamase class C family)
VDLVDLLAWPMRPVKRLCPVQEPAHAHVAIGEEVRPGRLGLARGPVEAVWSRVEALYRTGLHPAIQLCIRREGHVVLDRAIGLARGGAPGDAPDAPRTPATTETPFLLYSASKAITAMVVHKLDERGVIHLDDRVSDYIPEFGTHGKEWITIRHVLLHRAGIPNLPPGALDLDLLADPDHVIRLLCEAKPTSRPGRRLAYHAVSGGFVLGEVVRRASGRSIADVLDKEICEPLGFRWMRYGVAAEDLDRVARDAVTGLPVLPPFAQLLRRALGVPLAQVVELAADPRFLLHPVPAANVVSTARELSAFYQCLLEEGQLEGARVFDPRTVRRATAEQTYWEIDLTLGLPLRYGLGFMLGGWVFGLFGPDAPRAFGHLGFTNIFSWADPERRIAVALLTSGKPFVSIELLRLWDVLSQINRSFPKL